ncbi:uncharacterized protein M421DRAFT_3965 [Didymella exigua CBS 183.55]|uniref:HTH CENPB-type domain-containing protein n=1 Tax=Didymella exigua CBS 183.55 TaxID=1150837 RepID=A0A6A5RR31_9PLEO|nr:uncharacterized protein M421DRAFT_3965 [Didymella exigua CBS 183.55]KAF1930222.1 hypothetical protein M421DRAFT_3965 [Didymella exigua CBS 183.55]
MANKVLGVRGGQPVGKHWAERFRILQEDLETISAWFKLVEDTRAKYSVHDYDMHNFNKTSF